MAVRILGINGSPRKKNNASYLLKKALKGAIGVGDVEVETFDFAGREFGGCRATCSAYCMKNGTCVIKDDLNQLMERFLEADGIIWSVPVYHAGPNAQVKCAVDRLGHVLFSYLKGANPRLNKPCGAIVNGSSRWGGQELAIQFMNNHFIFMKCIPITGDMPRSYYGVAGYAPTWEPGSILEDTVALETSENLGIRVAEMAKIIKTGIEHHKGELPACYFCEKVLEERKNREEKIDMGWQTRNR